MLVASYTNQELGIEELASQLAKKADCAYYARVAKKIANKKNFATTELARLSKLVKASVAPAKRDQIQTRMNVLKKFLSKDVNEEL